MSEPLACPADLAVIDMAHSISLVGDEATAKEMLLLLHDKLPQDVLLVEQAYSSKNAEALSGAAHRLVGGTAYCGVTALKTAARALEYAADSNNQMAIDACYQQFHQELARFENAMVEHTS